MSSLTTSDGSGPFLPTTDIFPSTTDTEEFNAKIETTYKDIAQRINIREVGLYETDIEIPNGQQFNSVVSQDRRYGFRKVISIPTLSTGSNTIPHGISFPTPNTLHFTHIYGVIEDLSAPLYLPVPNDTVLLTVDDTNINITIPSAYNGFTGMVVLDYVKTD